MKPDVEVFDKDLQQLLRDTVETTTLINRVGNAKAHETNLMRSLIETIEQHDDVRYELLVAMTRPPRRPLEETRREQMERGINGALPRMYQPRQQPPPTPEVPPYTHAPRHASN